VGVIYAHEDSRLPDGTYVFREFFSGEARDGRRAVQIRVHEQGTAQILASFTYELHSGQATLMLDQPHGELAETLLCLFQHMLEWDPGYGEQLAAHFELWRSVMKDSSHPRHKRFLAARKEKAAGLVAPRRWWFQ
jgi:hypothetical protein